MRWNGQSIMHKVMQFLVTIEEGEKEQLARQEFDHDPLMVVLTNCSPGEAEGLASTLVREGLAACVNVIPGVTSFYIWEGKFTQDSESTLVIKTIEQGANRVIRRLRELHSYTTPEVLMLKPDRVDPAYLGWVREQTRSVE